MKGWYVSFNSSSGYMTDNPTREEREQEEHVVRDRQKRQEGPLLQVGTSLLDQLSLNTSSSSVRANFQRVKVK